MKLMERRKVKEKTLGFLKGAGIAPVRREEKRCVFYGDC